MIKTIRARAICTRCKMMLVDPSDAENLTHGIRGAMILDPNDEKDRTHRTRKDGTPCGGPIAMSQSRPKTPLEERIDRVVEKQMERRTLEKLTLDKSLAGRTRK
ncbi:MAG: hypothetical protein WCA22_08945 [Candidatus Binatus sp.]